MKIRTHDVSAHMPSRASRLFTVLFILSPVLHSYTSIFPGFTLGELMMALCGFGLMVSNRRIVTTGGARVVRLLWLMMFGFLFLTVISVMLHSTYSASDIFTRSVRRLFYVLLLGMAGVYLDKRLAPKLFVFVALFASVGVGLQWVWYQVTHEVLTLYVPGWHLMAMDGVDWTASYTAMGSTALYRPTSIFIEPSYFALYGVLALAVLLLFNVFQSQKALYGSAFVLSVAVMLSTSTSGIVLLALVWLYFFWVTFSGKGQRNGSSKFFLLLFGVALVGYLLWPFLTEQNATQYFLEKFTDSSRGSNGPFRVMNGRQYLELYDTGLTLFGCGFGNERYFFQAMYQITESMFSNGFDYIWMQSGVLGLGLFLLCLLCMIPSANRKNGVFLLLFAIGHAYETPVFRIFMPLYLVWIVCGFGEKSAGKSLAPHQPEKDLADSAAARRTGGVAG